MFYMASVRDFIKDMEFKKVEEHAFVIDALKYINELLPSCKVPVMTIGDFVYVTMCSNRDLDMAKASIISFILNSKIHPKEYIVVSDGTWSLKEGEEYFDNFVSPLKLISWEDCVASISEIYPEMAIWCQKQIWGRKLAAIITFSLNSRVLFSDSDVLWFKTPFNHKELENLKLKLSVDNDYFYDNECIKTLALEGVYTTSYSVNCGIVFVCDFDNTITPIARECMKYEAESPGNFSEQTFFAILNMKYDSVWTPDQIRVDISDMMSDFAETSEITNEMIARHYVWRLKWIFWKDYITMRLSIPDFLHEDN